MQKLGPSEIVGEVYAGVVQFWELRPTSRLVPQLAAFSLHRSIEDFQHYRKLRLEENARLAQEIMGLPDHAHLPIGVPETALLTGKAYETLRQSNLCAEVVILGEPGTSDVVEGVIPVTNYQ